MPSDGASFPDTITYVRCPTERADRTGMFLIMAISLLVGLVVGRWWIAPIAALLSLAAVLALADPSATQIGWALYAGAQFAALGFALHYLICRLVVFTAAKVRRAH